MYFSKFFQLLFFVSMVFSLLLSFYYSCSNYFHVDPSEGDFLGKGFIEKYDYFFGIRHAQRKQTNLKIGSPKKKKYSIPGFFKSSPHDIRNTYYTEEWTHMFLFLLLSSCWAETFNFVFWWNHTETLYSEIHIFNYIYLSGNIIDWYILATFLPIMNIFLCCLYRIPKSWNDIFDPTSAKKLWSINKPIYPQFYWFIYTFYFLLVLFIFVLK